MISKGGQEELTFAVRPALPPHWPRGLSQQDLEVLGFCLPGGQKGEQAPDGRRVALRGGRRPTWRLATVRAVHFDRKSHKDLREFVTLDIGGLWVEPPRQAEPAHAAGDGA
jgi:hypothetical protein